MNKEIFERSWNYITDKQQYNYDGSPSEERINKRQTETFLNRYVELSEQKENSAGIVNLSNVVSG
jgi:hypothetical protein